MLQTYTTISTSAKHQSKPLLAAAALHQWNMSTLPPIQIGAHGKPYFSDSPLHFNLSHSGTIILCALSDAPVGADIQFPRPSRPRFLDEVCSTQERHWLRQWNDAPEAFALLWALKESAVKRTGRGITRPLSAIVVPLPEVLPTDDTWCVLAHNQQFFSSCMLHGGMVSICSDVDVTSKNIFISSE